MPLRPEWRRLEAGVQLVGRGALWYDGQGLPKVARQQDHDAAHEPVVSSDVPQGPVEGLQGLLVRHRALIVDDKLAGLEELGRSSALADVADRRIRGSQVQRQLEGRVGSPSARQQRGGDSRRRDSQRDLTHDAVEVGQDQVDDKRLARPSGCIQGEHLALLLLDRCLDGLVGLALLFIQAHLVGGDELLQVCHIVRPLPEDFSGEAGSGISLGHIQAKHLYPPARHGTDLVVNPAQSLVVHGVSERDVDVGLPPLGLVEYILCHVVPVPDPEALGIRRVAARKDDAEQSAQSVRHLADDGLLHGLVPVVVVLQQAPLMAGFPVGLTSCR